MWIQKRVGWVLGHTQHLEGEASKGDFHISQIKQKNVAHQNKSDVFEEGSGHSSAAQNKMRTELATRLGVFPS